MAYDAFISYSHDADGQFAPDLRRGLEQFAKPWFRRRALRVFLDDASLSANPALWSSITNALDEADWFLLLASPGAAQSRWVNREIEYWLEHRDPGHILPILTHGDWTWDHARDAFDIEASPSVPPALATAFSEEPRHIDMRWAAESEVDHASPRFRGQLAEIAAPIHGVDRDDLEGDDLRQHRRTRRVVRLTVAVFAVLALVAAAAAVAAVRNARAADENAAEARSQRDLARQARDDSDYRRIVAESHNLRDSDRELSALLAVEARRLRDTPQSIGAIQATLVADQRHLTTWYDAAARTGFSGVCLVGGGRTVLAAGTDGTIGFYDLASGKPVAPRISLTPAGAPHSPTYLGSASSLDCQSSADGDHAVVFSGGGSVWTVDGLALRLTGKHADLGSPINNASISPDGTRVAAGTGRGNVALWPDGDLDQPPRVVARAETEGAPAAVAFTADGSALAATTPSDIVFFDSETGTERRRLADPSASSVFEPDRQLAFTRDGRSLIDSRRGQVSAIDLGTGVTRWRLPTGLLNHAQVAVSPDSTTVLVLTAADVELHAVETGAQGAEVIRLQDVQGAALAVSDDGATLVIGFQSRPSVATWALDGRGNISRTFRTGHNRPVAFSPSGRRLLAVAAAGSVVVGGQIIDVDGLESATPSPLPGTIEFADDDSVVGSRGVAEPGMQEFGRFDLATGAVSGPSFRAALPLLWTAGARDAYLAYADGSIRRYRWDGSEVGEPWLRTLGGTLELQLSPAGDLLAVTTGDGLTVYRTDSTTPVFSRPGVIGSAFDLDGSRLALIAPDNTVAVHRSADWKPSGDPVNTDGALGDVDFAGPDRLFLSGPSSGQIFDAATRERIGDPFPSDGTSVVSPDGARLAAGAADGVVIWDLDADRWERAACATAGRNLTRDEWATYFPNADAYHSTCPEWPAGS